MLSPIVHPLLVVFVIPRIQRLRRVQRRDVFVDQAHGQFCGFIHSRHSLLDKISAARIRLAVDDQAAFALTDPDQPHHPEDETALCRAGSDKQIQQAGHRLERLFDIPRTDVKKRRDHLAAYRRNRQMLRRARADRILTLRNHQRPVPFRLDLAVTQTGFFLKREDRRMVQAVQHKMVDKTENIRQRCLADQ